RLYTNLWTVFIFSGLWHGAAWTFVIWGAYHGFFLVIERMFLNKVFEKLPGVIRTGITFVIVVFGWVLFRAEYLGQAIGFFKAMLIPGYQGVGMEASVKVALLCALVFSFFALIPKVELWQHKVLFNPPGLLKSLLFAFSTVVLLMVCISVIAASGFNPFIYFRF